MNNLNQFLAKVQLISAILMIGHANALAQLTAAEASHVVEFQFNPKQEGAETIVRKATLGEVLGDNKHAPIVDAIRRCARAITRHQQIDPFRGGSPLIKIDMVYDDESAGFTSIWFTSTGLRAGAPNTERVAFAFITNSGRIRSLYFEPKMALPEFQLSPTEAETPDKAHAMFITLLDELGINYSAHETEIFKTQVPQKNLLTIFHREPLAGLLYGSGNGIEAFFERYDIDGAGERNSPNMALSTLRFSYARPYIAPTQPIPDVQTQRQRALDVLRQRFSGVEDIYLMPFAPKLGGIPVEEGRDRRFNRPLSARHQQIREQNLSIVTNAVRVTITRTTNPESAGHWGLVFDTQTGELLEFRRLTDGPGSSINIPPLDPAKPMTLDGMPRSLNWRKSFLIPSGVPHSLSQGNLLRTAYWNEAYQLWMVHEGDHSLVAPKP